MAEVPRRVIEKSNDVWVIRLTGDRALERVAIYPDGSVAIAGFTSYKDHFARAMYDSLIEHLQQQGVVITPPPNYKQLQGTIDGVLGTSRTNPTSRMRLMHQSVLLLGSGDQQYLQHPTDKLLHFGIVESFYESDLGVASITLSPPVTRIIYRHFDMRETRVAVIQTISEPQTFNIRKIIVGAKTGYNPGIHYNISNAGLRGLTRMLSVE